jgi:hypothetical protein
MGGHGGGCWLKCTRGRGCVGRLFRSEPRTTRYRRLTVTPARDGNEPRPPAYLSALALLRHSFCLRRQPHLRDGTVAQQNPFLSFFLRGRRDRLGRRVEPAPTRRPCVREDVRRYVPWYLSMY